MSRPPLQSHYEVIVIGAGMSGMAAAIRLGHFGKKVLLLDRHGVIGGLNSFYKQNGRKFDVGLHAVTNYVPAGTKRAPLTKLLRQLRLSHEEWDLSPQVGSRIAFPDVDLCFTNDFALLESEIARAFPAEIDRFRGLVDKVREFDELRLDGPDLLARSVLAEHLRDPLLIDMLLCPLMYYGSAREGDMDFYQFVIMFKALFLEGFARPFEGVRHITQLLLRRLRELKVERVMNCGVKVLHAADDRIVAVELEDGRQLTADHILSSAGLPETGLLLNETARSREAKTIPPEGSGERRLSFVETIGVFPQQPRDLGWEETIIFFNDAPSFAYARPTDLVDPRSGVICFPNNYQYGEGRQLDEGFMRVTCLANPGGWMNLPEEDYRREKARWFDRIATSALRFLPGSASWNDLKPSLVGTDMFTPRTVKKYTGHLDGAVYGATNKVRNGTTPFRNLYLCGTDQGFLGITGAMLSGISMANLHILQAGA